MANYGKRYCGVPQCKTYQNNKHISMHKIPLRVEQNKTLKKQWMSALKMGKDFPKYFRICSLHFESKFLLSKLYGNNLQKHVSLSKKAFPTENLPKSSVEPKRFKKRRLLARKASALSTIRNTNTEEEHKIDFTTCSEPLQPLCSEVEIQCSLISSDVKNQEVQANIDTKMFLITTLWSTDQKVRRQTGIPSIALLKAIVILCKENVAYDEDVMSMRDKVLLTMRKLKSNLSFADLAVDFESSFFTVKKYFSRTIQLLAKVLGGCVYWQSREENLRSMPICFKNFPHVRTVLDCTEVKISTFGCLSCRTSTYSHYKGQHTVKILIGVAPAGLINYISPAVAGRTSDKAMFNASDLLKKLEPGDAVMVDKGFLIGEELAKAGIEMIRPYFAYNLEKEKIQKSTEISKARVHVERRIGRLKSFKVLSDKLQPCMLPYIDEILIVLAAISNLSEPILGEDKFLKQ